MAREVSARISGVSQDSPAAKCGLRPGDELLAVNSKPVSDIFDYSMKTAEPIVTLLVRRDGRRHVCFLFKDEHEDLGLQFEEDLFDGLRTCANDCIFCFVRQSPNGLRRSLCMRDDDFRLSLAHGNYITLTNLTDSDMDRICSMRIGRLYVSVHATEPDLRIRMMRSEAAGSVMVQLERLAKAGILMHAQIVLCPGVNDGEHLQRTVEDLSSLYPWVRSIAIVPVGLTKYRDGLTPIDPVTADIARDVVRECQRWQRGFRGKLGSRLVFASDEFCLLAGMSFPSRRAYEGFPQLEDGVGLSRLFLDNLYLASRSSLLGRFAHGSYVLVTGELAVANVTRLAELLCRSEGVAARVCIVHNKFWGQTVTVAGLLTGGDIADALKGSRSDEHILIPDVMLKDDRFLDDMAVDELRGRVDRVISVVPTMPTGVLKALSRLEDDRGRLYRRVV